MLKRIISFLLPCFSEPKYDKPQQAAADIELFFPEKELVHTDQDQDLLKSVHLFDSLQDAYLAVNTDLRDLKNRNAERIEDLENEVDRQAEIIEDLKSMVEHHVDFHEDLQDRIEFFGMQNKKNLWI
ncbi:hypothetical protein EAF04_001341 [Stromatinia cepivora]|nr:hypothetical protein EAF04_001341 [Stromatinia cepivora]